ncbi:MAG: proteasome assembly chaperone family protein [Methermicoccaceae archaeon]
MDDIVSVNAEPSVKNPTLIEGFPGVGLIGNITVQHLIEELDMEQIGTVYSPLFPPIAILLEGIVNLPIRIYQSEELELVTVLSDIPILPNATYPVAKSLIDWCEEIGGKEVVSVAGVSTMGEEHNVFGAATTEDGLKKISNAVSTFEIGSIAGISGGIITECYLRDVPAIALLGETHTQRPDPRVAANVVEVLNKIMGMSIDTQKLHEQAEQIELEMHKLAEQVSRSEAESALPKREFPMYG